ncbi:MAG: AMP-dependent synthetase, partial [Proteobacteria bacterium]|nr:AMP-dependent synthetase [Pseudomonadota bacterium]
GKPDKIRGEIIKAFIILKSGYEKSEELAKEIQDFVKKKLSAHEYPKEIEFTNDLPMTITGKIMRRELRRRELEKLNK